MNFWTSPKQTIEHITVDIGPTERFSVDAFAICMVLSKKSRVMTAKKGPKVWQDGPQDRRTQEQGVCIGNYTMRCHTVKLFHSRNMSFGPFLLHYKYFSESKEKLTNH
jgi:hypothetical protein